MGAAVQTSQGLAGEIQSADDETTTLVAMDAAAAAKASASGTGGGDGSGSGDCGDGGWGRKCGGVECEARGTLERTVSMNQATAGAKQEQSAVGAGGGCSLVMRRADIGRGDGSRRNDAVEVGGVASVRGSGAAASAGLEGSDAMSCEFSKGAVSGVRPTRDMHRAEEVGGQVDENHETAGKVSHMAKRRQAKKLKKREGDGDQTHAM